MTPPISGRNLPGSPWRRMLSWRAYERLPAPQREKHTHGQYERNAQEGRLASLFFAPNLLLELARVGVAFSRFIRLSLPETFPNRHQRQAHFIRPAAICAHCLHCESFVRTLSGVVTALFAPRDTASMSEYHAP